MDLTGKVVVVTGATSGLGQSFAIDASKRGAKVVIVGRDEARAQETLARMGGTGEVVLGDVSTIAGAKAVAKAVLAKAPRIDVLVNNAGGTFKTQSKTADGVETTFALNTLAAWVLARELHSALAATKGRIVNLATGFLDSYSVKNVDDLVSPSKYAGLTQYGQAKQASVMMTVEQAKRLAADGISVIALHPGIIMGTRFNGGQPKLVEAIAGPILRLAGLACTMDEAMRRFRVAAFDPVPSGSYVLKGKPAPLPKPSQDEAMRARVVSLLEKLAA